jgi:hypothetical protein
MGTKEEAAAAVKEMVYSAINPDEQGLLFRSGALHVFVNHLQKGTPESKFSACQAIGALTANEEFSTKIGETKAIANLVEILYDSDDELQVAALQTLGNLTHDEKNQKKLLALIRGVEALVTLLSGNTDHKRRVAAGTVGNLAIEPDHIASLLHAGAVPKLVDILRPHSFESDGQTIEVTTGALRNLAQVDAALMAMLAEDAYSVLDDLMDDQASTEGTRELAGELLELLSAQQGQQATQFIRDKHTAKYSESGSDEL